uniref:C2H2-type domain-containing protein n=1 Tax=Steinernema glaseri TaxID=37863 RepID=A0A1I7YXH3_9BILA
MSPQEYFLLCFMQQMSQNQIQAPMLAPMMALPPTPQQSLLTPPNTSLELNLSSDSGVASSGSSGLSTSSSGMSLGTDTPRRKKKIASTFCRMCQKDVSPPDGKKNQGPLRHVRQVHMNGAKVYQCKLCSFAAHYDKTHVIKHIARHHPHAKPSAENIIDNSKQFDKKTTDLIAGEESSSSESSPQSLVRPGKRSSSIEPKDDGVPEVKKSNRDPNDDSDFDTKGSTEEPNGEGGAEKKASREEVDDQRGGDTEASPTEQNSSKVIRSPPAIIRSFTIDSIIR